MKTNVQEGAFMPDQIFVIGHRNPDTDSSTSAVAYSRFLNTTNRYEELAVPVIPGQLTPQAKWVFQAAEVEYPERVETLAPRVADVLNPDFICLQETDRLRDAVDALIRNRCSMLPVVDSENRLKSVFSNREDTARLLLNLDVAQILGSLLTWTDLTQLPGAEVLGNAQVADECGSLVVALGGSSEWPNLVARDDILVVGSIDALCEVPVNDCPTRLILVSSQPVSDRQMEKIKRSGLSVIRYPASLSDLLFSLSKQVRLGALNFQIGMCIGADDLIEDVHELIASQRRALPVVDNENRLVGVIARKDLKAPARRKAILVDHFEADQAVPGIDSLEIIEVIDHHRIGNIETQSPIRVDCRPIGSSCSIVALNFFEAGIEPDKATAILMLGGICADTLVLKGPTTTTVDEIVAEKLCQIADVDLQEFGRSVLLAGDDLMTSQAAKIWNRDQKVFGVRNQKFAVAQLETVALNELTEQQFEAFRDELQRDFDSNDYLTSMLVVTDVVSGNSWIAGCESKPAEGATELAFGDESPHPGWVAADNVVSRKKQIVPTLMKTFAEFTF